MATTASNTSAEIDSGIAGSSEFEPEQTEPEYAAAAANHLSELSTGVMVLNEQLIAPEEESSMETGELVSEKTNSPLDTPDNSAEATIKYLQRELYKKFDAAKNEYETTIANKNAEIEKLQSEKKELSRVILSNKKCYEAEIERITLKLRYKQKEIDRIIKEFESLESKYKQKETEHENAILKLKSAKNKLRAEKAEQELKISKMETNEMSLKYKLAKADKNTAVAKQTIAEERQQKAESKTVMVESELEELKLSNSSSSITSSRSDSSASVNASVSSRSNSGENTGLKDMTAQERSGPTPSLNGESEPKEYVKRPEHIDPFTRSLLRVDECTLDERKLTGKMVRLAIIDDGFYSGIAPFKSRIDHDQRFTFDGKSSFAISPDDTNCLGKIAAIVKGLQHGTAVATIAAGRDFYGLVTEKEYMKEMKYPGGVAPEAFVTCFSYRTTSKACSLIPSQPPTASNSSLNSSSSSSIPPPPPPLQCPFPLPKFSSGSDDSILHILQKICKKKFDVVSMSVCMNRTDDLDKVIGEILDQGTLIFAGTSNEGDLLEKGYPACLSRVVSVGSLDQYGSPSEFTYKEKPYCDVYTFGEVLVPNGKDKGRVGKELPEIIELKGTSFATPAVAGLACLAIERAKPEDIKKKIISFFQCKRGKEKYLLRSANEDFIIPIFDKKLFTL